MRVQSDHEKYIRRAEEAETAAKEPTQAASSEAAALYQKQDLSLKDGETIKCEPLYRVSVPQSVQVVYSATLFAAACTQLTWGMQDQCAACNR